MQAYELVTRSMTAEQVGRIDIKMPWLRRPRVNCERHCDCEGSDIRVDGDDEVCLDCGVRRTHIVLDAVKEEHGFYAPPPRRYHVLDDLGRRGRVDGGLRREPETVSE